MSFKKLRNAPCGEKQASMRVCVDALVILLILELMQNKSRFHRRNADIIYIEYREPRKKREKLSI